MTAIGFIGLGVMGGPMCANIARKHDGGVIAFDLSAVALSQLSATSAKAVATVEEIWNVADVVFMSLPGGRQVEALCLGESGLAGRTRKPHIVIDLSTTSVGTARTVGAALGSAGVSFCDAPVARTREAAQRGELSIMAGATKALFDEIAPLLSYIGTDITHVGPVGAGQFVKLINNALLDVNVIAIAESVVLAEKAGIDPAVMIEAVSKGSGDSYGLRNHAIKSILPKIYPANSFPPEYKLKDLDYLLELGNELGSPLRSMELARTYYQETIDLGFGGQYFTAVREAVEHQSKLF